ncbi:MAG: CHAT domain-containing protein, partial [Saprospiraceae bacterium]|nr:CHAT domain-containing protein [Saprospiraceae bacterium]
SINYDSELINRLKSLKHRKKSQAKFLEANATESQSTIQELRQHLSSTQGLVNYLRIKDKIYGIYLDRDTSIWFQKEDQQHNISKGIRRYQNSLQTEAKLDPGTLQQYLGASRLLYDALISPFAFRLKQKKQLVVIPDQQLDQIPFEAFLTQDISQVELNFRSLPYLLHQVEIRYSPAWKVFTLNQQRAQENFQDQSIGFWTTPELKNQNGLEIIEQSIQGSFQGKYTVFASDKGGKALFSRHHQNFNILHFLLHARSDKINRYDNYLEFGSSPSDLLYGFELYAEKIRAKLIILSSCESAAGVFQTGEGTFSLTRSFLNAGASQVLSAQYIIPQANTAQVLQFFYQALGTGQQASTALHRAKLKYIQEVAKDRHAFPRFWAGLVLYS